MPSNNLKKSPQNIIDKLLCEMTDNDVKMFFKMCRFNANYTDLQQFLVEKTSYEVDIPAIAKWFKYHKPEGKEAMLINEIIENWEGVNPNTLLHITAGITANLVLKISDILEIQETSETTKLVNLIELIKELRQISIELTKISQEKDTAEIYKSGIIALANELKMVFRKTPIESIMQSGISSSLDKLL